MDHANTWDEPLNQIMKILNCFRKFQLRERHAKGDKWAGVDINKEDISDNLEACVWEPAVVKINALTAATEAACLILSVDETIKAPQSNTDPSAGRPF